MEFMRGLRSDSLVEGWKVLELLSSLKNDIRRRSFQVFFSLESLSGSSMHFTTQQSRLPLTRQLHFNQSEKLSSANGTGAPFNSLLTLTD
jgi:hypothetical protein